MLEILTFGGGKPYYPDSGPGPKSLQWGNLDAGYFGTLSQTSFLTATEIFSSLGISDIPINSDTSMIWCKFFYKGKVVYIPTRPLSSGGTTVSWGTLYQYGMVYGVDADGSAPYPVASPVNQRTTFNKVIDGNIAGFWPRLASASGTDPDTTLNAGASGLGEMAELMTNVLPIGFAAGTGKWDKLDPSVYDNSTSLLMLTTVATSNTGMLTGKAGTQAGKWAYGSSSKGVGSTGWAWWPVLRYLNPKQDLLDLTNFKADSPPPKAVDLYVDQGESTGGLIGVRSVSGNLTSKVEASASASRLRLVTRTSIGLMSPVPYVRRLTLTPMLNTAGIAVKAVSTIPRGQVTVNSTLGAFAIKATYSPAPLTNIKLEDK